MSFKRTTRQEVIEKMVPVKEIKETEVLEVVLDGTDSISSFHHCPTIRNCRENLFDGFDWDGTKEGKWFWEYVAQRLEELYKLGVPKK